MTEEYPGEHTATCHLEELLTLPLAVRACAVRERKSCVAWSMSARACLILS